MAPAPCTCERIRLDAPDGDTVEGIVVRDPNCRQHGYPDDQWRAGFEMAFLGAVRSGKRLSAQDALRSHELCERVLTEITGGR